MIPSDLVARLRLLSETTVRPLAPVHEIPADLPEFSAGQRFTARIDAALPDGTFRAVAAGRNLTLALPQPAQPGDTLDLLVTDRQPNLVIARRAADAALPGMPAAAAAAAAAPATTLSAAAQLISTLFAGAPPAPAAPGQAAPGHDALPTRVAPVLAQPPAGATAAASLAPALQQAIGTSGLFYEAHQAQWIAGRYTLDALEREPQARHARAPRTASAAAPAPAAPADLNAPEAPREAAGVANPPAATRLAPELQSLVQQQLDAAATQQIVWRGELWPGQTLHWEISEEERHAAPGDGDAGSEAATRWNTTLRLVLPQLGEIAADLRLTPAGVGIALSTADASGGLLRAGQAELAAALAAAGVPLLALTISPPERP